MIFFFIENIRRLNDKFCWWTMTTFSTLVLSASYSPLVQYVMWRAQLAIFACHLTQSDGRTSLATSYLLPRDRVTIDGFGLIIGFIDHLYAS
jgi:hypothetical protein